LTDYSLNWANKATKEAPHFYEAWHWRAHIYHMLSRWSETNEFSKKIFELSRQSHHLVKPEVWQWWGYDLIALSAHKLGNQVEAIKFGQLAIDGSPDDQRLKDNLKFYTEALKSE
jgi:tetratricopeptide (TPR) repeat protein